MDRFEWILGLLLTIPAQKSFAQSLVPFPTPGAVYTEVYFLDASLQVEPTNYSFEYTGDTLAGPYVYQQLEFYAFGNMNPVCTYYDNGRVYYHDSVPSPTNPTGGMLLYDFNLGLGDTFYYPVSYSYFFYSLPFVVDSVDTVTLLNSQVRKYIRLTDGQYQMEWVDGVGDINNGFFYIYGIMADREHLVCVSDSTGPLLVADTNFYCDPLDPIPSMGPNTCDLFTFDVNIYYQSCNACDGVISIMNLTGGTGPYTYTWSSMGSGNFETDICLGQEIVTITDANGNSCARSYYMGWNLPTATFVVDPYPCDGVDTVTIVPLTGISPFVAMWWPQGVWSMTMLIDSSGQYWVTVRDNAFCATQIPVDITHVELLQSTAQATGISCVACCDGNVALNITGGHPPFSISSVPGFPAPNNFCQGWYQYCVTDSMGCIYCDSVYVPGVTDVEEQTSTSFSMYPNPADESVIVRSDLTGEAIIMTDVNGSFIFEMKIVSAATQINTSQFPNGIYFVSVGDRSERLVICRQ
jgi:hypothetical protein